MVLKAYSVYDSAVQAYTRPFFARTDGEAIRSFVGIVNDNGHHVHQNPQDYSLHRVGEFDEGSGIFTAETAPVHLGSAVEYLHQEPDNA